MVTEIDPGVQFLGISLIIIVLFIFVWGAWYYVVNPLLSKKKRNNEEIKFKHYLAFVVISFAFLITGFLFFYVEDYWKLIPFSILVIFYFWIKR